MELRGAIDGLFPESLGVGAADGGESRSVLALPAGFEEDSGVVVSTRSGYVQAIDGDRLLGLATGRDLVLRVERRPGSFAVEGGALVRVWPGDQLDEALSGAIRKALYIGGGRSLTQDAGFAVDQLVEIAVRALSPGINDPFTAMACLDRLGACFCQLAGREAPSSYRLDESGRLRVVAEATSPVDLVDAAFRPLRQAARGQAEVCLRLLETIALVASFARDPGMLGALRGHMALVHQEGMESLPSARDRVRIDARYGALVLANGGDPGVPQLAQA
jgi:uncharacterized membrane protein